MKIAIIGTGTMGNGIAQAFAQGGHNVVMKDLSDEFCNVHCKISIKVWHV